MWILVNHIHSVSDTFVVARVKAVVAFQDHGDSVPYQARCLAGFRLLLQREIDFLGQMD
jgi:hypothetical protein